MLSIRHNDIPPFLQLCPDLKCGTLDFVDHNIGKLSLNICWRCINKCIMIIVQNDVIFNTSEIIKVYDSDESMSYDGNGKVIRLSDNNTISNMVNPPSLRRNFIEEVSNILSPDYRSNVSIDQKVLIFKCLLIPSESLGNNPKNPTI